MYVFLVLVLYDQTNTFLCTTLMAFYTQGTFSACVPDCPSFKINLQSKELTLRAGRVVGNVQMQMWECLEELLQGPEALPKDFAAKRKSVSGSSFKQCITRNRDDLVSLFMKYSNRSVPRLDPILHQQQLRRRGVIAGGLRFRNGVLNFVALYCSE